MSGHEDLQRILQQADAMPTGVMKVKLLEEAVRIADSLNEEELQFHIRLDLIGCAFEAGVPDRMLNAISWCLGKFDESQGELPSYDLLWDCKHALSYAPSFPTISREQLNSLQEDVKRRYRAAGHSLRPIHQYTSYNQVALGDYDLAWESWLQSLNCPKDRLWDGIRWEQQFCVEILARCKGEQATLEYALPLISDPGAYHDVTPWTFVAIVEFICKHPEHEEVADHVHEFGYRYYRNSTKHMHHASRHMFYKTVQGNFDGAMELFQRHASWLIELSIPPGIRMSFYRDGLFLLRQLQKQNRGNLRLRFPDSVFDGEPQVDRLEEFFAIRLNDFAQQFDARNGNDSASKRIAETFAMEEYVRD